ncbi:MAG TPA: hypothetical protein VIG41_01465 [Micrococcaceae bacterium]
MQKLLAVLAVFTVFSLTGCGAVGNLVSPKITPEPSVRPSISYGQTASDLAASVPQCGVNIDSSGNGDIQSGVSSRAICLLSGLSVYFYCWKDAASQASFAGILQAGGAEAYYAEGTGWTAMAEPPKAAPDLVGEQAAATDVVAALGGRVSHYHP